MNATVVGIMVKTGSNPVIPSYSSAIYDNMATSGQPAIKLGKKKRKEAMDKNTNEINNTTAKAKMHKAADIMIPKHRFDCINLCLKETKQALKEKALELGNVKALALKLKKALLISKVETAIALHDAKNLTAVKALIDFSNIKLERDGSVSGLEAEVLRIKKSQSYLFEGREETMYVMVPMKSGDPLNKSIANYINKTEK